MTHVGAAIREWRALDRATFRDEILPRNEPALLRGLVGEWPAVQAGLKSARALCEYVVRFDAGAVVKALNGPASIQGRFFYADDMTALNFERRTETFRVVLDQLLNGLNDPSPPAIAIQATSVAEHLPGFEHENVNPLLDVAVLPRIWIGNAVTVHLAPAQKGILAPLTPRNATQLQALLRSKLTPPVPN